MAISKEFLEYLLDQLAGWPGVTARRMFGGAGLFREGVMFGLVADDVAYLRVDDTNRAEFERAGSTAFQPFEHKKRMTMPYYQIPADVLEQRDELRRWAERAFAVARRAKKK